MIVQSFRSVMWVGAVAGAALSCYMVSLRVAAERAVLEDVETRILLAKRDIRALDTELSTRGRLRQLERWNVDVLALTAPTEGQFLQGEAQLASLTAAVERTDAPVRLAASPPPRKRLRENEPVLAAYRPGESDKTPSKPRAKPATKSVPIKLAGKGKEPVTVKAKGKAQETPKRTAAAKDKSVTKTAVKAKSTAERPAKTGEAKVAAGKKAKAGKAL